MTAPPFRIRAAALLAALAAACVSPTPYRPAEGFGPGYRERKIESDRYRVTFAGNEATARETVELSMLHRAAELTLEQGFQWFVVTERATSAETEYDAGWAPFADPGFVGLGLGYDRFPYHAHGYLWSYPVGYPSGRKFEAAAYVLMRSGAKPAEHPFAYDARQVVENLGPILVRP